MRRFLQIAAVVSFLTPSQSAALDCQPGVIADLDVSCIIEGSTEESDSGAAAYSVGAGCTINTDYPCQGDVFEVFLSNDETSEVGFSLDLENSQGDLVLILTDEDGTCIANSPDFIGRGKSEAIPKLPHPRGTYFVHVDTALLNENGEDVCAYGEYKLQVTGTNPPELNLLLDSRSKPQTEVIAGSGQNNHVHEVKVENPGPFRATGIELAVETSLPPDLSDQDVAVDRGDFDAATGTWSVGTLESGESATLTIVRTVGSGAADGATITTTAQLTAVDPPNLGDPLTTSVTTDVRRKVKLDLATTAEPSGEVIAGAGRVSYTVRVRNLGPSDASGLVFAETLTLPADVEVVAPITPSRGHYEPSTGLWTFGAFRSGAQATLRIVLDVTSSARNGAEIRTRTAVIKLAELNDGETETGARTTVRREVTLQLETDGQKEAVAGGDQVLYTVRVRNDSRFGAAATGVVLVETLTLPDGVEVESITPSQGGYDEPTGTWAVGVLESGGAGATLEIVLDVGSSVVDGEEIQSRTVLKKLAELNTGDTETEASTTIRRELALHLETIKKPPDDEVFAGGGNLVFTVLVRNEGPSDASGLVLEEILRRPEAVRVDFRSSPDEEAYDEGENTWNLGVLGSGDEATLTIVLDVVSSVVDGTVIRTRTVVTALTEPNAGDTKTKARATVRRKVTLDLDTKAEPQGEVVAGAGNLVYTVSVANLGPSDASGLVLKETLTRPAAGVGEPSFTASPDDFEEDGTWTVGVLTSGSDPATLKIVLPVRSSAAEGAEISTLTEVTDIKEPNDGENETRRRTTVRRKTDLSLKKEAAGTVDSGDNLVYTLTVDNNIGPSNSSGGTICDTLPDGAEFVSSPDACSEADGTVSCDDDTVPSVTCQLDPVPNGETAELRFVAFVGPDSADPFTNRARVDAKEDDDDENNDAGEATTEVLDPPPPPTAALTLRMSDSKDPVLRGDPFTYTLTVVSDDSSSRGDLVVLDTLSADVTFLDGSPGCGLVADEGEDEGKVACRLADELPSGGSEAFQIAVQVNNEPKKDFLINTAELKADSLVLDTAEEVTSIVEVVPTLLLPVFAVDSGENRDVNTFFAVRNPAADPVELRYEVFDAAGNSLFSKEEFELAGHATYTSDLRQDLGEEASATGFIAIAPTEGSPALSGDERRVDLPNGLASGNLLLDVHPSSVPGLCQRWDAGFLNGGGFDGGTSFLFFVPELPESDEPLVTGRVYTPKGKFVQKVEGPASGRAFELDAREDLDLLAKNGTVEWTFREGVKGSVAALFRAFGSVSVAVPAYCKDELPDAGEWLAPHLYLPRFEVDPPSTVFSVRNGGDAAVTLRYEYFNSAGQAIPNGTGILELPARGAHTVDVARLGFLAGDRTGYAAFTAIDPESDPESPTPLTEVPALHGESFLLGGQSASGEVLVDTRLELVPRRLCRLWNAPFLTDDVFDAKPDYAFFIASPSAGEARTIVGHVYAEAGGEPLQEIDFEDSGQVFVRSSGELGIDANASTVEWQLPPGTVGQVTAVFRSASDDFSVGVAAVCQDTLQPVP